MSKLLFNKIKRSLSFGGRVERKYQDINPEDIFLDSTNLPGFDSTMLEGRIERPMGSTTFASVKVVLCIIVLIMMGKLWSLSILDGPVYAEISDNNRLEQTLVFANRGLITDRNGLELAGNAIKSGENDFPRRLYVPINGLAHVVGYVKYPLVDKAGIYYEKEYRAKDGVERAYDAELKGKSGKKLVETDVLGAVTSESVIDKPEDGETITLSIDARVNEVLYNAIKSLALDNGFVGGAAVIMDVNTGELLALTSYPEYDQNALTRGMDQASFNRLLNDKRKVFLNRAVGGLYTPGSIIKPILALGALEENIISPEKEILSTGSITVPNPYDPEKPSIFKDWKAHGWTDMREALAVSSDTYFYSIGGGFGNQKGLGISLIDKYLKQFSVAETTGIELGGEVEGLIPTPEWKAATFGGDIWRLGDTYITAIGQYGTQITPLSAARFIGAVANKGKILKPSLLKGGLAEPIQSTVTFDPEDWRVVHEGMREGVTYGTSVGLNVLYVKAAGKTGTAEVGSGKTYVHSWSVGFFPYENPRYAWAVVMERGMATNTVGATYIMRQLFDWISVNAPEYFKEVALGP
ncbi:MAG: penicillin-binding transpeptidase domain-containing protein [bacterium]|nr:penicillin-binding transpeptidase domain-containing protein [bacterium]